VIITQLIIKRETSYGYRSQNMPSRPGKLDEDEDEMNLPLFDELQIHFTLVDLI